VGARLTDKEQQVTCSQAGETCGGKKKVDRDEGEQHREPRWCRGLVVGPLGVFLSFLPNSQDDIRWSHNQQRQGCIKWEGSQ
jgi:hypothetical protein